MAAASFTCSPTDNPCAQCGEPIERPIWSEHGGDRMSFVWSCGGCGYQFTTIAIFRMPHPEQRRAAA
ncbi:hypothetical protein JQ557_17520 [Bradyrhizobium sp. U87765 SZCCT0131]|uniref:hypothetical protein n=1 Tax=unclassified Bradyrhizobium TaxID=2631580 RepID=UPI001BABB6B0|nr:MULTISPECIES: hypothetical protein [unclassified Bradyrhizobium]MBR1219812.1 hypothetical protein [Bradyrhizobium sp. U87765 SZCCT0131]MBR1262463.1 hypothetical protein [Bradyrhizobium sp. U87765 SZCCT0134]MBR1308354.1 hypothetical protein [Bradyrhizobium sp. U87765 SZCCT0110]MBR1318245.1 hypothetical protein [Bradyrhizobium sp. U87765 SZCCT0109]MBR1351948.1 hypothetical protein [Bradyrhizobium sp. U87765 SZCCT0048]